jgi:hypothetical protein
VENIECSKKSVRSKSRPPPAVSCSCNNQPAITNKIFIYLFICLHLPTLEKEARPHQKDSHNEYLIFELFLLA